MLIAVIVLVPVVWDVLSFSNRFAGPVFRVRRILREIARSGSIEHVRFRQGDYWHGLADDLNAAFERLAASASGAESSAVEAEHAARMNSADAYSPAP